VLGIGGLRTIGLHGASHENGADRIGATRFNRWTQEMKSNKENVILGTAQDALRSAISREGRNICEMA
jgi:hypothetical protein